MISFIALPVIQKTARSKSIKNTLTIFQKRNITFSILENKKQIQVLILSYGVAILLAQFRKMKIAE